MQELATYADASVALADRNRSSMLYVHNCVGRSTLALRIEVGTRVPIAPDVAGPRPAGRAAGTGARLPARTHQEAASTRKAWNSLEKSIRTCIDQVAKRGFCLVDAEWRQHVRAVAVPLVLPGDRGVMALNCAGPSVKLTVDQLENDLGPRLVHLARNVESMLHRP